MKSRVATMIGATRGEGNSGIGVVVVEVVLEVVVVLDAVVVLDVVVVLEIVVVVAAVTENVMS